jgi:hypothetical protein
MRRQSPSSSGLLPATYSRRRRGRPNELVGIAASNNSGANITQNQQQSSTYNSYYSTNNDTYEDVGSVSSGNDNNNFGLRTRGSPTRQTYTDIDQQNYNDYDSDENDENNYNRNNNHYNNNNDVYERGYEDVLDKPLKLSDFLINDRCYQRYLLEGKRSSYRGIINGVKASNDNNKGFMDPIFLAKVCTVCSFIGMLFLLFVAIIIETQPLYIKGVKVYSSSNNEQDIEYRFRKETSNALKASAAYFLTMVLSIIYVQAPTLELNPAIGRICHLKRLVVSTYFRYRRRHYDAIPDNGSSIFGGGSSSTSGSILPTHHSSANGSEGDKLLKSRRRKKRSSKRKSQDDSKHDDEDRGGGVLGKIKSWGIMGGGSSQTVRKKDR